MTCTSPFKIYTSSSHLEYIEVPCGRCLACRIQRTREWTARLIQESDSWASTVFLTLTYDDAHLPADGGLHKDDLQKFFKRLRRDLAYEDRKIRYYACGEYGDRGFRPHYHAIVFGLSLTDSDKQIVMDNWLLCDWSVPGIRKGSFGTATYDSFSYVTGYIQKKYTGELGKQRYGLLTPPFQVCSQGLGKEFALANKQQILEDKFVRCHGVKQNIPRYYLKKFFPDGIPDAFRQDRVDIVRKNKMDYIDSCFAVGVSGEKITGKISIEREQKNANDIARASLKSRDDF